MTSLDHLIADAHEGTTARARLRRTFKHRNCHYHVFETAAVVPLLGLVGFQPHAAEASRPWNLRAGPGKDNVKFRDRSATFYRVSSFRTDRPGRGGAIPTAPALAPIPASTLG